MLQPGWIFPSYTQYMSKSPTSPNIADSNPQQADLLKFYLQGVVDLQKAMLGLTPEQLHTRPIAGKWSCLEVLCHLSDCEQFFVDRMKRTLAMERPLLLGADASLYPAPLFYQQRDVEEELNLFAQTRAQMARILQHVDASAWGRQAVHNEVGLITLRQLITHAVSHLSHHLAFVAEKRKAMGL